MALIALALFALMIWIGRERIAGDLIDDALAEYGIEASYDIVSIGPQQQVIENIVIGDPTAPDFTAERVNVDIGFSLGSPRIGRVELVRPRLYGTFREGVLSLGALDPLIYGKSDEPGGLPDFDLAVIDGRARIASDYGVIGLKFGGSGPLDDGFAGKLAATAPGLTFDGCTARNVTIYGDVTTNNGSPRFEGPIRLREGQCGGASLQSADILAALELSDDFATLEGDLGVEGEEVSFAAGSLDQLRGNSRFTLGLATGPDGGMGNLALSHDFEGTGLAASGVGFEAVTLEGTLRTRDAMQSGDWQARIEGEGAMIDAAGEAALASARDVADGTFIASLLGKLERGLARSVNGGRLAADITARSNSDTTSIIVPEARLRSPSGETVLALSRVSYSSRGGRLSGNFLTGGADLPRINGRMQQSGDGDWSARMTMADFRSGQDALAIPRLELRQERGGSLRFNGMVEASGVIPGGEMRGLVVPLEGSWSSQSGLLVGQSCTDIAIGSLSYAALTLQERSVTICPDGRNAMVRYADRLELALVSEALELGGELGSSPATIRADRARLSYPGPFVVEGLEAVIGPDDSAARMTAAIIEGGIGDEIGGTFEGGTAAIDAVVLDLSQIRGSWAYQDGVLSLDDAAFTLTERTGPGLAPEARFEPLTAQGATLILANNVVSTTADLRHPASGTKVASLAIEHALASGVGHADIDVPSLRFGNRLQPQDLSYLASGVIALADGEVTGEGRIDWTSDAITSSGAFRTDNFDFAAAFGPVKGVRGEIVFTDLINLTTAPSQVIEIASVNPGIEALGGRIKFAMENGTTFRLEDGRWPFMGGDLILYPTTFEYGGADGQNYVFEITGLDAASFVSQLELSNIGATGTFDGTIQVFFDANGNGSIERGLLISRPPGGNVSYVGELTYEDLGTMANYAFQTLRSLDYNQMSIELSGNLGGEIVTNFNIDGVRQGEGASRNFITRQLAQVPIRFKINVRSENFAMLATIARGFLDPTYFDSEFARELVGISGIELLPADAPQPQPDNTETPDEAQRRDEPAVQPPESDDLP
ncbi:YdbH domain-containing protein [uncultured Erythrobacter sp.]|uniref:intermembrane phospholipid transport protein YdbH family protein n=1 Tax=uncultured Erythrobacter sp. TaxID=263913 RepID=UPI002619A3FB|nr:YdbH domain-containing protein [uncultured Erythrobacter sp.]